MVGRSLRFVVACVLGALGMGCASGPSTLLDWKVPVHQQVAIMVSISEQVNIADESGGVATLAETISNRLKDHGIPSQIYASKYDHPTPPRIDVYISHWHSPSAITHQAAGGALLLVPVAGALAATAASATATVAGGGNGIVVDCTVFLPNQPKPAFTQRFERSDWTSSDDNASAESAGEAIVAAILKH
ncbi:MAG: hypothetical protein WDO69_09880 [Pseudomonadota bacterium]